MSSDAKKEILEELETPANDNEDVRLPTSVLEARARADRAPNGNLGMRGAKAVTPTEDATEKWGRRAAYAGIALFVAGSGDPHEAGDGIPELMVPGTAMMLSGIAIEKTDALSWPGKKLQNAAERLQEGEELNYISDIKRKLRDHPKGDMVALGFNETGFYGMSSNRDSEEEKVSAHRATDIDTSEMDIDAITTDLATPEEARRFLRRLEMKTDGDPEMWMENPDNSPIYRIGIRGEFENQDIVPDILTSRGHFERLRQEAKKSAEQYKKRIEDAVYSSTLYEKLTGRRRWIMQADQETSDLTGDMVRDIEEYSDYVAEELIKDLSLKIEGESIVCDDDAVFDEERARSNLGEDLYSAMKERYGLDLFSNPEDYLASSFVIHDDDEEIEIEIEPDDAFVEMVRRDLEPDLEDIGPEVSEWEKNLSPDTHPESESTSYEITLVGVDPKYEGGDLEGIDLDDPRPEEIRQSEKDFRATKQINEIFEL